MMSDVCRERMPVYLSVETATGAAMRLLRELDGDMDLLEARRPLLSSSARGPVRSICVSPRDRLLTRDLITASRLMVAAAGCAGSRGPSPEVHREAVTDFERKVQLTKSLGTEAACGGHSGRCRTRPRT